MEKPGYSTQWGLGGKISREERHNERTLFGSVKMSHQIMREEIFGPLFPVIGYDSIDEVVALVNAMSHLLALYYFTGSICRYATQPTGKRSTF